MSNFGEVQRLAFSTGNRDQNFIRPALNFIKNREFILKIAKLEFEFRP